MLEPMKLLLASMDITLLPVSRGRLNYLGIASAVTRRLNRPTPDDKQNICAGLYANENYFLGPAQLHNTHVAGSLDMQQSSRERKKLGSDVAALMAAEYVVIGRPRLESTALDGDANRPSRCARGLEGRLRKRLVSVPAVLSYLGLGLCGCEPSHRS